MAAVRRRISRRDQSETPVSGRPKASSPLYFRRSMMLLDQFVLQLFLQIFVIYFKNNNCTNSDDLGDLAAATAFENLKEKIL